MPRFLAPATQLVSLGREPATPGGQVGAPLILTSTYHAEGAVDYGRVGNPTWSALEAAIGALEGGRALTFASGMAAVSAVLSLLPPDAVVVTSPGSYNGVVTALDDLESAGKVSWRRVDITDTDRVIAALDGAHLLWLESPTNPLLEVADVEALCAAARERDVLSVVDNTFATPLQQQPLRLGAHVVVHSVTKYLSGHSDVVLGATVTSGDERGARVHEDLARHRTLGGAIPGPMEAWLALRGMRTLAVRFERACANAADLASRLEGHRNLDRVRYPGFGAIVSIEVAGGARAAEAVCEATGLWVHSTSLGGVESQLERRRRHPLEPKVVPENLVRLSVGIEDVEDLWDDLNLALETLS